MEFNYDANVARNFFSDRMLFLDEIRWQFLRNFSLRALLGFCKHNFFDREKRVHSDNTIVCVPKF